MSDSDSSSSLSSDSKQNNTNDANSSKGKKRQREEAEEEVRLSLDRSKDDGGPALAWFPGVLPPKETEYKLYVRSQAKDAKLMKQKILHGETNYVELKGVNYKEINRKEDLEDMYGYYKYLVGLYDKRTRTVTLKEVPVFNFSRVIKKRKHVKEPEPPPIKSYQEAKADLGRTFGSKKTIQRINDDEKNAVHVDMVANSTQNSIMQNIEDKLKTLPTMEQIQSEIQANRNIPPYNMQATEPANVYKLEDIVTINELNSTCLKRILDATTLEEALQALPYNSSKYITSHLSEYWKFKFDQQTQRQMQILIYISYLMNFSSHQKNIERRAVVASGLYNPPSVIIDNLYKRYTETVIRKKNALQKMTPVLQNKLYCYMFVLCLMLDNYVLDPAILANDLCISKIKVTDLLKSLGCRVDKLTKEERESGGFTAGQAKAMRKAKLQAPPVFPEKKRK
ncbi:8106_t:CDS:2 [Ambispora leptoticha]|uniref:8106_t:CDS:1 n=1 Tax=Ambispora leptoticha TaxID=144679 RepID=A0A9N8Z8W1_9GLOM|nr:8106_t:CDS:2 [Ambispora leptoticha]